jgi:hypothetical protein
MLEYFGQIMKFNSSQSVCDIIRKSLDWRVARRSPTVTQVNIATESSLTVDNGYLFILFLYPTLLLEIVELLL